MNKYLTCQVAALLASLCVWAQADTKKYPDPEFANEVYFLRTNADNSLLRLQKESSKMETKTSVVSGSEQGYTISGAKSGVRIESGGNLSFVFSNGSSSSSTGGRSDSVMRASGIDPSMMNMGMMDPTNSITLYKADIAKGDRKIYMMKTGGALPFSSHKMQSSDKYTFSVKKVRDGYWVLVIDKTLPRGEYAFTVAGMGMGAQGMDGSTVLYAFGVD